jgi:pyruvate/2-oxoglutarate dehydrogenase complex dihydrolipoamide dehydrogenase (E3) component
LSLNIEVTLMSRSLALKDFDKKMTTLLLEMLHSRGLQLMIGYTPTLIEKSEPKTDQEINYARRNPEKSLVVSAKHCGTGEITSLDFNTIVLAIGKKPCTHLLQLDKAG